MSIELKPSNSVFGPSTVNGDLSVTGKVNSNNLATCLEPNGLALGNSQNPGGIGLLYGGGSMSLNNNGGGIIEINAFGQGVGIGRSPNYALDIHCNSTDVNFGHRANGSSAEILAMNDAASLFIPMNIEGLTLGLNTRSGNPITMGGDITCSTANLKFSSNGQVWTNGNSALLQVGAGTTTGVDTGTGGPYINFYGNASGQTGKMQLLTGRGSGSGSSFEFYTDQGGGANKVVEISSGGLVAVGAGLSAASGCMLHVGKSGGESRVRIGYNNGASDYSSLEMLGNNAQNNWLISSSYLTSNAIEFTPSTAAAGHTYSTPIFKIAPTQLTVAGVNVVLSGAATIKTSATYETTGAGSAALGANCPAVTPTAPYKWIEVVTSDGSAVYIPVWK